MRPDSNKIVAKPEVEKILAEYKAKKPATLPSLPESMKLTGYILMEQLVYDSETGEAVLSKDGEQHVNYLVVQTEAVAQAQGVLIFSGDIEFAQNTMYWMAGTIEIVLKDEAVAKMNSLTSVLRKGGIE